MTQSLQIVRFGGNEAFQLMELEDPTIKTPDGVKIKVTASGVNFADLMMRMGAYPEAPKTPFTPGYEVAGVVEEVGSTVKTLKPGDRVVAGTRFGGYTSRIVLNEFQVRKIPAHLSDTEAAAIPVNFLTAWVALEEMARVRKGDRVLIQSAAGGVGIAAIQIAAQAGATVVGLVSSMEKAPILKTLGASEVMTYDELKTKNDEYQIILDATGGKSVKENFRRLASAGRLINYGAAQLVSGQKRNFLQVASFIAQTPIFTPFQLMMANKGIYGVNMLKFFEKAEPGKPNVMIQSFDRIIQRFEEGRFKVVVGKTFPLAEGGAAHTYLQSRKNIGKVVLTP